MKTWDVQGWVHTSVVYSVLNHFSSYSSKGWAFFKPPSHMLLPKAVHGESTHCALYIFGRFEMSQEKHSPPKRSFTGEQKPNRQSFLPSVAC